MAWINSCHVRRIRPTGAGLPPWKGRIPEGAEPPPPNYRRVVALTHRGMRAMLAEGFSCPIPGNPSRKVKPAAFVFMGGATDGFKSFMPGIMEEFLRAAQSSPAIPIYHVGGLGGATGIIVRALQARRDAPSPPEFSPEYYSSAQSAHIAEYKALLADIQRVEFRKVAQDFDDLWSLIRGIRERRNLDKAFSNGLDHRENLRLLTTTSTIDAVQVIWKGMGRVLLPCRPAHHG